MKRPAKVEFYQAAWAVMMPGSGHYAWRLRSPNHQIILSPHESFVSLSNAVRSFKTVCKAMDARTVFEVAGDAEIKVRAHKLLTR